MWFVAGQPVTPDNDTVSCQHPEDNVVRELLKKGYSWRSYQEDLPYAGFQGLFGGTDGLYYRRHNPLIDFTDVCPGTGQDVNILPFTQMAADFENIGTVNYAWITPDVNDDAHNGTVQEADQWLQANVPAILARPEFSAGGDGILFIVWDEATLSTDNRCSATISQGCGGRTAVSSRRLTITTRMYWRRCAQRWVCRRVPAPHNMSRPWSTFSMRAQRLSPAASPYQTPQTERLSLVKCY
jgi:hypothetical protein